jgi:ribosomal protein L19
MVDGVGVKWMIRIYDPLIKSISIIDKRFAYRFKKTTRSRSKLYYLFDKDPTLYQVKNDENDVRAPKTAKK